MGSTVRRPLQRESPVRPGARLIYEVLDIVHAVEHSRHLSSLVFLAQECGASERIYEFSPLGPEPLAPVSSQLELDLHALVGGGYIIDDELSSFRLARIGESDEAGRAEIRTRVRKAEIVARLGEIEPERLIDMAKVVFIERILGETIRVVKRAERSLFMSQEQVLQLLGEFQRFCEEA